MAQENFNNFNNVMPNYNNLPTPKQLWKEEKSKYRHWIILFGIGLILVLVLYLVSTILNLVNEDQIITGLSDSYVNAGADAGTATNTAISYFRTNYQILPILSLSFVFIGFVMYLYTIYRSYESKSFARISSISTLVIGIGAFISVFQLLSIAWNSSSFVYSLNLAPGTVFQFVNYFVNIFVYFIFSVRVTRIKRAFQRSEVIERQKNDPRYQQMMNQFQNGNFQGQPFGPGSFQNNPQPFQPSQQNPVPNPQTEAKPAPKTKYELEKEKLNKLKKPELVEIAKSLSISGHETMLKSELVDAILNITSQDN